MDDAHLVSRFGLRFTKCSRGCVHGERREPCRVSVRNSSFMRTLATGEKRHFRVPLSRAVIDKSSQYCCPDFSHGKIESQSQSHHHKQSTRHGFTSSISIPPIADKRQPPLPPLLPCGTSNQTPAPWSETANPQENRWAAGHNPQGH
jgi:hypothetical protein